MNILLVAHKTGKEAPSIPLSKERGLTARMLKMKGETKTVRAQQGPAIHHELHKILARNATDEQLAEAKEECIGTTFVEQGVTYCVTEVFRDSYKRLIAVGILERAMP